MIDNPGRSWPLGPVPVPRLLWPLSKCAAHHFDCFRFAQHPTQRGRCTGTDVGFKHKIVDMDH